MRTAPSSSGTCLVPREGAVETLEELRARGIKVGLITVCTEDVELLWPESEFAGLFDAEIFSNAIGLSKPDPRIYLACCEQLGVEPHEAVFVGDGANDELEGARRVGLLPILIHKAGEDPVWPRGADVGWFARDVHSRGAGGAGAMLITTMNDVPGHEITDVYGEVFGLTVRSRNIGSQIGAGLEVDLRRRAEGDDEGARRQPHRGDPADDRRSGGEGRERRRRDAVRHVRDGRHLDGDLRVRHGREDHARVIRRSGADEAETQFAIQRDACLPALAHIFPPELYPFPDDEIRRRWREFTGVVLARRA